MYTGHQTDGYQTRNRVTSTQLVVPLEPRGGASDDNYCVSQPQSNHEISTRRQAFPSDEVSFFVLLYVHVFLRK